MKIKLILVVLCVLLFTGCSTTDTKDAQNEDKTETKKIKVVSTIFPGYDFTKQIGNDLVEVSMLIPPGADSHSYEVSPQDIINIQEADLFIYTGGESDEWIDKILSSMDKPVKTLEMVDSVELLENESIDEEHDHEHEDEHADHDHEHENHDDKHADEHEDHEHSHQYDEHIWTSVKNAMKISEDIKQALCEVDEANASIYEENLNTYLSELEDLDSDFVEFFDSVDNKTLVFGDRFPFRYFANDYNLDYHAAYSSCSAEMEPSVSTVTSLIDTVKKEDIETIFYIESSNQEIAKTIAEATGAKTKLLHSAHNLSKKELDGNITYTSIMENNLNTLKETMK